MKNQRRFLSQMILGIGVSLLCLTGCIIDSDDVEPKSEFVEMHFRAQITSMEARLTCEGNGISGEADVYSRFRFLFRDDWDAPLQVLKETEWVLVGLERNETVLMPGVEGTLDYDFLDGKRIVVFLETYENDPGGVRDVQANFVMNLGYQENQMCWTDKVWGDCIAGSDRGKTEFHVKMHDDLTNGHDCFIRMHWEVEGLLR